MSNPADNEPTDTTPQSSENRSGAENTPPQNPSPASPPLPGIAGFLERFSMPERLMLFGSGIAFLLGFFHWYSFSSTFMGKSYGGGASGFNPWYGKLFFVTSLATVVLLAAPTLRQSLLGKQPVKTQRLVFLGLVAASALFGPLWFIMDFGGGPSISASGVSAGRTIWCWLALFAAAAAVVGGILHLKEGQATS